MSIPTAPDYDYAPAPLDCTACYDSGKSPAIQFLALAGIQRGLAAGPGDPQPPNGVYRLDAIAPCVWQTECDGWTFFAAYAGLVTSVAVGRPPAKEVFWYSNPPACQTWAPNWNWDKTTMPYYGGHALLSNMMPPASFSERGMIDQLGIWPDADTWILPIPIAGGFAWHRIFRTSDKTYIRVRVDHS